METESVTFTTKKGAKVHATYNFNEGRCYLQIYGKTKTSLRNFNMAEYLDAESYCHFNNF